MYVIIYLAAIILANLSVTYFGPSAAIINAFLFIGLDLTARDRLHEQWHNNNLIFKMFLLIVSGSALSWALNHNAFQIAIASSIAFGSAAVVDAIVYQTLYQKHRMVRINGSNIFSAATDSIVFPTVAFGSFLPSIVIGQFLAKVVGGFVWSIVLNRIKRDR